MERVQSQVCKAACPRQNEMGNPTAAAGPAASGRTARAGVLLTSAQATRNKQVFGSWPVCCGLHLQLLWHMSGRATSGCPAAAPLGGTLMGHGSCLLDSSCCLLPVQPERRSTAVATKGRLQTVLASAWAPACPVAGAGARDAADAVAWAQPGAHAPPQVRAARPQSAGWPVRSALDARGDRWRPGTAAPCAPRRELWAQELQQPPRVCAACPGAPLRVRCPRAPSQGRSRARMTQPRSLEP